MHKFSIWKNHPHTHKTQIIPKIVVIAHCAVFVAYVDAGTATLPIYDRWISISFCQLNDENSIVVESKPRKKEMNMAKLVA